MHYRLFHENGVIYIDLNSRAKVYLPAEEYEIKHFYKNYIPKFNVKTLNIKEIIAEKISAVVLRYAPRDYYNIYNVIKKDLPIDIKLVKKNMILEEFSEEETRSMLNGSRIYCL